jgi:hypothetical protein
MEEANHQIYSLKLADTSKKKWKKYTITSEVKSLLPREKRIIRCTRLGVKWKVCKFNRLINAVI